jgi:type IV pilus assembly protein PilY1
MVVYAIKVDGKDLMSGSAEVKINADSDIDFLSSLLAGGAAANINQQGFRAVAQGRDIYIIAPQSAVQNLATPEVELYGKIDVSVEPFKDIARSDGTSNSLADIASYYFRTDLRQPTFSNCPTDRDLCTNNVPVAAGSRDGNFQHMVTHTLGLGASGTLNYREDYAEATSGDFADIMNGSRDWPDPMFYNGPERVDDLWHAAVNGGGRYFNASNPESLSKALSSTLSAIRASIGAAAAASTSSQQPVEGDNLVFASSFRSMYWDGDVEARRINLNDGSLSIQAEWSASTQLDKRVNSLSDNRKIWVQSFTDTSLLKNFLWSELDGIEKRLFSNRCSGASQLSQCNNLTSTQTTELTGERLVNYLRGQFAFEDRAENNLKLFRRRDHVLGAVMSAQPLYVGRPAFRYADENYGAFRDDLKADRKGMLYVAANDGMLHALDAATGAEAWAFIPAAVCQAYTH